MLSASSITLSNSPKGQGYMAHPTFFIDRKASCTDRQRRQPALITPAQANKRFDPAVTVGVTALAWPAKNAARAPSKRAKAPNRAPRDTVLAVVSATCFACSLALATVSWYCCWYCCT